MTASGHYCLFFNPREIMLHEVSYVLPDQEVLFQSISIYLNRREKAGLIGNNGVGKSTLMKILAGVVAPASGTVSTAGIPYYIPQALGQFDHLTIAEALGVSEPLSALRRILAGEMTGEDLETLNDEWDIEERCREALEYWGTGSFALDRKMSDLSGGEKTQVFLAGIGIHQPELILMGQPTNHLDIQSLEILTAAVKTYKGTLFLISHDAVFLQEVNITREISL